MITPLAKLYLKVFLAMGIPFAILMTLIDVINGDPSVLKFLMYAILFGGLMSGVLVSYHAVRVRRFVKTTLTDEVLGVSQKSNVQTYITPTEFFNRLASDPFFRKAQVVQTNDSAVIKTPSTWETWGELIKVKFQDLADGRYTVQISSKPRVFWTLLDYGKDKRNVQRMENLLTKT